jgi:mevalonate kinase
MAHLGRGRAKLLLFGEHAAVYGFPAVGLALDQFLTVTVEPNAKPQAKGSDGDIWQIEGGSAGDRDKILEVIAVLQAGGPRAGLRKQRKGAKLLSIRSSIPRGLGFGSSAALCVALAEALATLSGGADRRVIWESAHRAEELFHGTPSGIDTGLALLGGLHSFLPRPPRLPRVRPLPGLPLHLVVGAVPRQGNTGALVAGIRERVAAGDRETRGLLRRLGELAQAAADLLGDKRNPQAAASESSSSCGKLPSLGYLAAEAQGLLRRLGLSTDELERVLEQGRRLGALGGKLSGAGGGGAFYLLFGDGETARKAADSLRQAAAGLRLAPAASIYALSRIP